MSFYVDDPSDDPDGDWPPEDPVWAAHYERLASRVRPEGMTLDVRHGTEGPEHDPYGWTEYRVHHPGRGTALYRSGILSERLDLTLRDGTEMSFVSPEYEGPPDIRWIFEDWLKETCEQLDFWANADWERGSDVREAELAAGWDPNP